VKAVHVPGGRTLTTAHWGDYDKLDQTCQILVAESQVRGLKLAPLSLEIYGYWSDDPKEVRTDPFSTWRSASDEAV
jgi:effector-binding domain-containing protein